MMLPAAIAACTLQLAAWLALGALGLAWAPSLAMAFIPLAVWMAASGTATWFMRRYVASRRTLALVTVLSSVATAAALQATHHDGGFAALLLAALAWAVVNAAAGRLLRDAARAEHTAVAAPLAASIAVLAFHRLDDARSVADAASALVLTASVFLLVWRPLSRTLIASATHHLPSTPTLIAARCVMVPMMASLAWSAVACRAAGIAPAWMVATHLAAMFLPAALVRGRTSSPRAQAALTATVALLMVAGAWLLVIASPSAWAAGLLQGAAWSLAGLARPSPSALVEQQAAKPAIAVVGAVLVALLGAALATYGSAALSALQIALGLIAGSGWLLAAVARPGPAASRHLRTHLGDPVDEDAQPVPEVAVRRVHHMQRG